MRSIILLVSVALSAYAQAEQWQFSAAIQVTKNSGGRIFHHLDSTGRNNLAISGNTLAAIWEDNHAGSPQVYLAYKKYSENSFSREVRLSTSREAYSPVIASVGKDEFLAAWQQDDGIWCRHVSHGKLSAPLQVTKTAAKQVSVVRMTANRAVAVWVDDSEKFSRVMSSIIELDRQGSPVRVSKTVSVDKSKPNDQQLYPVIKANGKGAVVVWEDRRHGHTILMKSYTRDGESYSKPAQINESVQKSKKYGSGSGVTRVALSGFGTGGIAATWMDKRSFKTGYDIYAALSNDEGRSFSKNMIVQDPFGDNLTQWNPAIAGNRQGDIVVVWDDDRNENSDIWMSWKTEDGWSEDYVVAPASESGQQTNPVISFDDKRNLHLVWLDQQDEFGPTRLMYSVGQYVRE